MRTGFAKTIFRGWIGPSQPSRRNSRPLLRLWPTIFGLSWNQRPSTLLLLGRSSRKLLPSSASALHWDSRAGSARCIEKGTALAVPFSMLSVAQFVRFLSLDHSHDADLIECRGSLIGEIRDEAQLARIV